MKNLLKKKHSGAMHFSVVIMVFILAITMILVYCLSYRKVKFIKYEIDNDVILATLAANVADIYEFATYNAVMLDTGVEANGYGAWDDDAAFRVGCNNAVDEARKRFDSAIETNLNISRIPGTNEYESNSDNYKDITLEEFIIYNVKNDTVYICDDNSISTVSLEHAVTPSGQAIESSGVYVKMSLNLIVFGSEMEMEVQEYVDFIS